MFNREQVYQRRQTSRWAQVQIVAVGLILLLPIALAARHTFTATDYSPILIAIQTVVWTFHGVVLLRILATSTHAAAREFTGNDWDLIVLTGVSTREILWAKWRSTLYASRGWLLALGLLRLGVLPCCVVAYVIQTIRTPTGDWVFWNSGSTLWLVPLLMGSFTILLTLLDVVYTALLGTVAGIIMRRFSTAMLLAGLVRFLPVIGVTLFAFQEGQMSVTYVWVPWRWWITLAEGGTGALIRIPIPDFWLYANDTLLMQWVGLVLGVVTFTLWLLAVCWIGLKALSERGALVQRRPQQVSSSITPPRHS